VYYFAAQAARNNNYTFHLAAILWRGKTPVAIGFNGAKTSPRYKRQYKHHCDYQAHAEMVVLKHARPGDVLEVFRVSKSMEFTMAKPCPYCMEQIEKAKLKKVRYTNWEGEWTTLKN
jgi:deoxycytidylate deaminase